MTRPQRLSALAALVLSVGLTACGGDGGGDAAPAAPNPPPPAAGPATPLTITGVAATGAALADASVAAKCQRGTGSATTAANGAFAVALADAALPCVLRVTKGATVLHSVVETGATLPASANVTPLTELLTAQLAQGTAASLYDTFSATAQARLTTAGVATATGQVRTALARVVDLSADDLLRGALVPSVNGGPGNLLDLKLDAIARALRETNTSLAALAGALVAAPGTPVPAFATVPESAATCPALRTGTYVGFESEDPQYSNDPFTIDAKALTAHYDDEDITVSLKPVTNQPCRFTVQYDLVPDEWVVSSAGVVASLMVEDGKLKPSVFAPVVSVPAADYAGVWNYVGYAGALGIGRPVNGSFTLDAAGAVTTSTHFVGTTAIASPLSRGALHGVRAPNGELFLMGNPGTGAKGMIFAARQAPLTATPVGDVASYWEMAITQGGAQPFTNPSVTVVSATGETIVRRRSVEGSPDRLETLTANTPRDGLRWRSNNACTDGAGAPVSCPGNVQLPMRALGLTANAGLADNTFFSLVVLRRP